MGARASAAIGWARHHLGLERPKPRERSERANRARRASDDWGILMVRADQRGEEARGAYDPRRYLLFGERPEPTPSYLGLVEPAEEGKVGIACSGGGVRSAAFSLGALQTLQHCDVLKRATYLAGVSGGSYIASAFCMVRKTWPGGNPQPAKPEDGWDDSDPGVVDDEHPPFAPGSPEEQYLRNRSSYLAPGGMGKLVLGYRLLLGLSINLAFVGTFLFAASVALACVYRVLYPRLGHYHAHVSGWIWVPVAAIGVLALIGGCGAILAFRWSDPLERGTSAWSLRLALVAAALGIALIGLPVLLAALGRVHDLHVVRGAAGITAVGGGTLASVAGSLVLYFRSLTTDARKLEGELKRGAKIYRGLSARARVLLAYAAATVAGPALALTFVLGTVAVALHHHAGVRWLMLLVSGGLFAIGYAFADLTSWSLHPFYRRRLCSAFALKRVARDSTAPPIAARPMGEARERDYASLERLSETAIDAEEDWPTLLICAAANISDTAATPPGRSVTSFTFSARAIGGPLVGSIGTTEFEDHCDPKRWRDFTLPAAVAMSGAALSPSMGKMTRRPFTFLMALANLRLGVWVPNPRRIEEFATRDAPASDDEEEEAKRFLPRPRPSYLLRELFGRNSIDAQFLYVTDGGHYENLGVVELLRRGCTEIYCFDASNDDFDALGDAVSLARSELGVEIDIDYSALQPGQDGAPAATDCVKADVTFPHGAPSGKLYYARSVMTARSPTDARVYHQSDPRFPHDPTVDQLYTDQRFEAYRALGVRAARTALAKAARRQAGA